MFNKLISVVKTPEVEFMCEESDFGIIPAPYPARQLIPDWYKHLPSKIDKKDKLNNSTIRRCAPFLDAMSIGWIIPLAADVEFVSNADGSGIDYKWVFYKSMVENHSPEQIKGHPSLPRPPMKFLNYWYIKLPKGYSAIFTPPLNRKDSRFECMSGVVDDTYNGQGALEYINFPFTFYRDNFTGIIPAGTPLVQMIPIKRDSVLKSSKRVNIRTIDKQNAKLVMDTRKRRQSHESLYRDQLWFRK